MLRSTFLGTILATALAASVATADDGYVLINGAKSTGGGVDVWLTVLHNNDAESQLIDAGSGLEDFGGAARFVRKLHTLRRDAQYGVPTQAQIQFGGRREVMVVSAGDNFLPGPEFNASLENGLPFYDTIMAFIARYDVMGIGNHEFDFGPDTLADFIEPMPLPIPFVSANLDVSGEPRLARLADEGRIAPSVVITRNGTEFGVIGVTTERLRFISSPRDVVVDTDVVAAVNAEAATLMADGVDKIVLLAHLQSLDDALAIVPSLSGVDVVVSGGGDEILANHGDLLIPGDENAVEGPYPLYATDADGVSVPVVTGDGNLTYVGQLTVGFDTEGVIVAVDTEASGPKRVSGVGDDAVTPHAIVELTVVDPVERSVAALGANVIATSEVALDGVRTNVRTRETNQGNLIADALRWQAAELAGDFGVPVPEVGFQNGGGIRNDAVLPAGNVTELDTFDMLPFSNFVVVVPDVSRHDFKALLENAYSRVEFTDGRFAQVSGFRVTYDATLPGREYDADGVLVVEGQRVREIVLDDGTVLVEDGAVVAGPPISLATIDFLARGGDQYPFGDDREFTAVGVSYQQALENYIVEGLGGFIDATMYPETPAPGEERIIRLNKKAAAAEAGLAEE